ncbi:hypothetical protein N7478_010675 [Penicillium angulare]|uniref:uncharacterized protein n=1 Tax=Penicillium angulare TaxID=116970 RepID=UPI002540DBA7|nr:uncharacterized protein N7478_010675 [Penicillium angulare]KAJ5267867.1 hypothetical protein N7478_010675 [Penicillium angulare]
MGGHAKAVWLSGSHTYCPSVQVLASAFRPFCRVDRGTFEWAHRLLDRACVLQTSLHVSCSGIVTQVLRPGAPFVTPFLAASSLVLILPCTLRVLLRRRPQAVIKDHYALALLGIGPLAYHLIDRVSAYSWVLLGVCARIAWDIVTFLQAMWSHGSWRFTPQRAIARSFNRLLWIDIAVPARWDAQPGQYVQLWMPGLGVRSWLQLPAFYVASGGAARDATRTLRLVARSRVTAQALFPLYFPTKVFECFAEA